MKDKTAELKSLQTERQRLLIRKNTLTDDISKLTDERTKVDKRLKQVATSIENLSNNEVVVSEHAIIRYLERVHGIDMDKIRENILEPHRVEMIEFSNGNATVAIEGHKMVVKNNVVVTVK